MLFASNAELTLACLSEFSLSVVDYVRGGMVFNGHVPAVCGDLCYLRVSKHDDARSSYHMVLVSLVCSLCACPSCKNFKEVASDQHPRHWPLETLGC